jgi:uncharacterized cupin superfamily protein
LKKGKEFFQIRFKGAYFNLESLLHEGKLLHTMIKITQPSATDLDVLGVKGWPIWEKEASSFPWTYDEEEWCYVLEGLVKVTTENQEVTIKPGDFVVFPKDLSCHWEVIEPIRKHYSFN